MRDFLENKIVTIRSFRLLSELRTFIWKNNKQQAMQGYNDDLVMAFGISMYLRETSLRFRTTMEKLTYSSLDNFTKNQVNNMPYNPNPAYNQITPWEIQISTPMGPENHDMSWLI
jgi:hypothetical protein